MVDAVVRERERFLANGADYHNRERESKRQETGREGGREGGRELAPMQ